MIEAKYLCFFDTETTKVVDYKLPADHPQQARLASLAFVQTDLAGAVVASAHIPIYPAGWTMPAEATAINGWTDATLQAVGHDIAHALYLWVRLTEMRCLFIAHSAQFDAKVMRGECRRANLDDGFVNTGLFCTMIEATPHAKVPRMRPGGGYKWPSLDEAWDALVGEPYQGRAHNAMADVYRCRKIFFELMRRGVEAKGWRTGQKGNQECAIIAHPILDKLDRPAANGPAVPEPKAAELPLESPRPAIIPDVADDVI